MTYEPDLAALRAGALGHLREPLTVADLARQVHMSPRTQSYRHRFSQLAD